VYAKKQLVPRGPDGKDGLRLQPRWSSRSPGSLEGRTVRLHFTLKNARLYAFRVTKE
jgi:hypothetical protein